MPHKTGRTLKPNAFMPVTVALLFGALVGTSVYGSAKPSFFATPSAPVISQGSGHPHDPFIPAINFTTLHDTHPVADDAPRLQRQLRVHYLSTGHLPALAMQQDRSYLQPHKPHKDTFARADTSACTNAKVDGVKSDHCHPMIPRS